MLTATAASRVRVREPGMPRLEPGIERYRVLGNGAVILHLFAGDRVEVIGREGRQPCDMAAFVAGKPDLAALGPSPMRPSPGLNRLLRGDASSDDWLSGPQIKAGLRQRGIPTGIDLAARLLEGDTRPGDKISLRAQRDVDVVFHAAGTDLPNGNMAVDADNPPTDLTVIVYRATIVPTVMPPLPPALGDIVAEYRVDARTARAYEVKEGQFIQVIDVAGRQCSDFLCFDAGQLQKGKERGLDLTTTRTLIGQLYPGPGLASKYFDMDMQPLCEVVRDTVGRHDSFGLACTARF